MSLSVRIFLLLRDATNSEKPILRNITNRFNINFEKMLNRAAALETFDIYCCADRNIVRQVSNESNRSMFVTICFLGRWNDLPVQLVEKVNDISFFIVALPELPW